jgi:intein/homing endonuclease
MIKNVSCLGKHFSGPDYIIDSIFPVDGTHEVYDLEVEDNHNFIAGGLCVHNSSMSPNWQNL